VLFVQPIEEPTVTDTIIPALSPLSALDELRRRVAGDVLLPGDDHFEAACQPWNVAHQHRPTVVVVAATADDVVAAVRYARAAGVGLGVQATGHGVTAAADGGVLIVTRRMSGVQVDPFARTAWVSAGATWAPVLAEAQRHGLAPLLGSSPHVGAVGYTLGGGLGWLARKHGAAVDRVRRFEVVTAEGRLVRASAHEHPELFFALRGAGAGAVGIVTGMEIELVPVDTVYGGNLLYPAEQAAEVLARFARWAPTTPDELTSEVVLMNFPPLPEVPEPLRGRSFAILRGCWCGPVEEGRALLDAWRAELPPVMDLWQELPFTEVAAISNDPVDPMPAFATGAWMHTLDEAAARVLIDGTFPMGAPPVLAFSEVRHLGGAVARTDRDAALGGCDEEFLFHCIGLAPDPVAKAEVRDHALAMKQDLAPNLGRLYLNFVDGDERRRGAASAVGAEGRARLQALKAATDPTDVFRFGLDYSA
jgi:hypothetical protein